MTSPGKNYVVIFPKLHNFHLMKDVGMIPYFMSKFFDYNSFIVTYKNDNYDYLEELNKDSKLKLIFLKRRFNDRLNILLYILHNARHIDVLQFYFLHETLNLFFPILLYKILNPKGKVYVKLDADNLIMSFIMNMPGHLMFFQNFMLKHLIDCLSVETSVNYKKLVEFNPLFKDKLLYLPNGIDTGSNNFNDVNEKENYIITVGRLGTEQKATEILLEAFAKIDDLKDWKLLLIGSVEDSFKEYIKNYFRIHPHLQKKIVIKGQINNTDELFSYYSKSKIFCLPSRWESFAIVLIEAAYFGNYIISTDVGAARDILNTTDYGEIIRINDPDQLSESLQDLILNWEKYEKDPKQFMQMVEKKYNWFDLCKELNEELYGNTA